MGNIEYRHLYMHLLHAYVSRLLWSAKQMVQCIQYTQSIITQHLNLMYKCGCYFMIKFYDKEIKSSRSECGINSL